MSILTEKLDLRRNVVITIAALLMASACGDDGAPHQPGPGHNVAEPEQEPSELESKLATLELPPNFALELFTDEVPKARSIAVGPEGLVFVGSTQDNRILAVVDEDQDYQVDAIVTVGEHLESPDGIVFHGGNLYVAESQRILVYPEIAAHLGDPVEPTSLLDTLPPLREGGRRTIGLGPDGLLYVGIGAPCNACVIEDPTSATIARMRPDGSAFEIYAEGVRDSAGFDWHPETGELWFTDIGRDGFGDDNVIPLDELNVAPVPGMHFGFPYCHGGFVGDPEFGGERSCDEFTKPVVRLGHPVASLGMRFYDGGMFPVMFHDNVILAEYGSDEIPEKMGYRVTALTLTGDKVTGVQPMIQGFVDSSGEVWGRPVDVAVLHDGSLLVSDDLNGALYRLSYLP